MNVNQKKELAELSKTVLSQITSEFDKLDIYLPCPDKSGEIYNRNTGQRYTIAKTGQKVNNNVKDPIKTIGSFYAENSGTVTKAKIGQFNS